MINAEKIKRIISVNHKNQRQSASKNIDAEGHRLHKINADKPRITDKL
jgi:hypothetical protein